MVTMLSLSGCSVIPDWAKPALWFKNKEKLELQRLDDIYPLFEPEKVWSRDIGKGVKKYFSRLRPVSEYGNLYVADRHGVVAALDPATGKKVWSKNFAERENKARWSNFWGVFGSKESARISGGLTVFSNKVYFGTENGDVYALDAATGDELWKTQVKGEVLAQPAVESGVLAINTGAGTLFALDAETGEQMWSYESEVPPLTVRGVGEPVGVGGAFIFGTANGRMVLAVAETGQIGWEQVIGQARGITELDRIVDIDSKPLIVGGVGYVISYDGSLAAIELQTGRVSWKRDYRSFNRISLIGNTLVVVDIEGVVYALDRRSGTELWSQNSISRRSITSATPVGDYVVVGDRFGFLHWLSLEDGEIIARYSAGSDSDKKSIYVSPLVIDNTVYAQTRKGRVVAVTVPQ
jgi:outer membrane protein assembly factor BamB